MAEELFLQNAHLRMRVSTLGGKVQSLFSSRYQAAVLYENPAGGMFPMLPLANRVAGNRFTFQGRKILLPHHHADEQYFLHGDGWLLPWLVVEQADRYCLLQLRQQHACGFDYQARIRYELDHGTLIATMTLVHCGQLPMLYGGGFHPFMAFEKHSLVQFQASGHWPEGESHLPLGWRGDLPEGGDFSQPTYGEDRWLNVCYSGWNGVVNMRRSMMSVTISSQMPWLMLFRMPGEPFICLEPQSHPLNAHNMAGQPGLVVLGPGDSVSWGLKITVE